MKPMLSQPKKSKYYIRQVNGGYNGAVQGYPTCVGNNVLANCVGFANGRFNQIINDPDLKGINKPFKYQLVCNAENFIESAKKQGLKISQKPTVGGIMVWQRGKTLSGSDGAGHVAIVEMIYQDGSIYTSESEWNGRYFVNRHRDNSNGRWGQPAGYTFRGCIVNPAIGGGSVTPTPKLDVDGVGGPATVRAMQTYFKTVADGIISGQNKKYKQYYPNLTAVQYGTSGSSCIKMLQNWLGVSANGILDKKTVKAWQKKLGVDADGVFGPKSMKAWQRYLNENIK